MGFNGHWFGRNGFYKYTSHAWETPYVIDVLSLKIITS